MKKFSDVYVEPVLYKRREDKRLETRADINTLISQEDDKVNVEDLLFPKPDKKQLKVLVTGSAGSGKSMLSLQLLNKWLDRESDFEDVFFYSIEKPSHVKTSLGGLLFKHQYLDMKPSDEAVAKYVSEMTEKTLVVFDGLEAFGNYPSESETFDCHNEVEMSRLIGSIISGHTLKLVTLLVTSQPGGVDEYKKYDQVAEIHGFDETNIDKYVEKYCTYCQGDNTLKAHIDGYTHSNINISSLCRLPMFCSLVCRIGKMGLEYDREAPFPTTTTRLMTMCMDNFVREHHPNFSGKELGELDVIAEVKNQILALSKLAKDGMSHEAVKVVFSNKDIKNSLSTEDVKEFPQKDATQCGFLSVSKERTEAVAPTKVTQTYFAHLVMQEFFAAIDLVSSQEEIEKLLDQTPNVGQLDMVLTFIAGLAGDPENKTFLKSLGYDTTTKLANPKRKKHLNALGHNIVITARDLLELVVRQCEHGRRKRRDRKASIILLLRLVYESRDPDLWSEIMAFVLKGSDELDLSGTNITSADLQALTYVAQKTSDISSVE